jgi:archaellum component FlaC
MGMLDANDLKQIGDLMDAKLDEKLDEKLDSKLGEVLEVVNSGFSEVQEELHGLKSDVGGLKSDVGGLKQRVTRIEATMVTKSYLDDKLADLRGEFVLKRRGLA